MELTRDEAERLLGSGYTAQDLLADLIIQRGPIKTARVSSAQARGNAKRYAYWGAVRYELRLVGPKRLPANVAIERAASDRRSMRLAARDAAALASAEGRLLVEQIGTLSLDACRAVLAQLGESGAADVVAASIAAVAVAS